MRTLLFLFSMLFSLQSYIIAQNPVLHLDFRTPQSNYDSITDLSGFGNHAYRIAGQSAITYNSVFNGAYFNGNALYRFISSNLNFPDNFSVYFDFYPDKYCAASNICDWNSVLSRRLGNNDPWNLVSFDIHPETFPNTPRYISFNASAGTPGTLRTARSAMTLNSNQNYKVIGVKMGCLLGIYIDCVLDTVINVNWGMGECTQPNVPQPWLIGGNSHPNQFFKGYIKEIKMFDYALSVNEINYVCNALNNSELANKRISSQFINVLNVLRFSEVVSEVAIYDISGRVVRNFSNISEINLEELTNGAYFATYSLKNERSFIKFLKY